MVEWIALGTKEERGGMEWCRPCISEGINKV
jgi:hypothetical protein